MSETRLRLQSCGCALTGWSPALPLLPLSSLSTRLPCIKRVRFRNFSAWRCISETLHSRPPWWLCRVKSNPSSSVTIDRFFARDGRCAFAAGRRRFHWLRRHFSGKKQRHCYPICSYFVVKLAFSVHLPVQQRIPNPVVVDRSVWRSFLALHRCFVR